MSRIKEAVACILFSSDRREVLLIKRRDVPVWVLPGGGIDKAEMAEEAAIREMEEETGLKVSLKRKIALYLPVNRLTQTTHFFECMKIDGELRLSEETLNIGFFPLSHLPKEIPPPYLDWIHDALCQEPTVICKPIKGVSYWVLIKFLILHPLLTTRFLLAKMGLPLNR